MHESMKIQLLIKTKIPTNKKFPALSLSDAVFFHANKCLNVNNC